VRAEEQLPDVSGGSRRDGDRNQSLSTDLVHSHLDRKQDPANRRIESGSDPSARAGRNQGDALPQRQTQQLSQG